MHDHVSAAFHPENVALHGDEDELRRIVAGGPRGAIVLAGLSVAVLLALWLAFFVFAFLPRGAIG
jgi:hypothetical protein